MSDPLRSIRSEVPVDPCPLCRNTLWWRLRGRGTWACTVCHPQPQTPSLVEVLTVPSIEERLRRRAVFERLLGNTNRADVSCASCGGEDCRRVGRRWVCAACGRTSVVPRTVRSGGPDRLGDRSAPGGERRG